MLSLCFIFFIKRYSNDVKQSRRFNKEQIKKQLLDSFVYDKINKEDLSAKLDTVNDCQKAVKIIKEYENIIKTIKKNIICFRYEPGKIRKKFKENTKFKRLVEQFKTSKSTMLFRINIAKLVDRHAKMLTLSITLNFLKSYYKDIKNICKKNPELFS